MSIILVKRINVIIIVMISLIFLVSLSSHIYLTYIVPKKFIEKLSQINEKHIVSINEVLMEEDKEVEIKAEESRYVNIIQLLNELKSLESFPTPSGNVTPAKKYYSFKIKTTFGKPFDSMHLVLNPELNFVSIIYEDGLIKKYLCSIILKTNDKTSKLINNILSSK